MAVNSDNKATTKNIFDPTKVYGLEAVAKHFSVTVRTAQRWAKERGFPVLGGRWYSLVQIEVWLQQKKGIAGPPQEGHEDPAEDEGKSPQEGTKKYWELENIKNQAKTRELEYRRRKGELGEYSKMQQAWNKVAMESTRKVLMLERILPPLVVNKDYREVQSIVRQEVRTCVEALGKPMPDLADEEA